MSMRTSTVRVAGSTIGETKERCPLIFCCGSAGIYNLVEPETSDIVLERKLGNIAAAAPAIVATGNPGCLMQIGAGLLRSGSSTRTVHPVELLDRSYANRVK